MILDLALDLVARSFDPVGETYALRIRAGSGGYEVEHADVDDAARYSLNCVLGLEEARRHGLAHPALAGLDDHVVAYVRRHAPAIRRPSDAGLLCAVCAAQPSLHDVAATTVETLLRSVRTPGRRTLNAQDLAWMLWGAVAAADAGLGRAETLAHELFRLLCSRYVVDATALPRHTRNPLRAGIVSFGSLAYYLKAVYDYADWSGSDELSMAMLFLLPARRLGLLESDAPIVDSVAWVTRTNELGTPLVRTDPFLIFRAVEPARPLRRVSRYLSAAPRSLLDLDQTDGTRRGLRIDTASHLYEWGWLLYAWADPRTRPLLESTWAGSGV
jgi:hypothetical protein